MWYKLYHLEDSNQARDFLFFVLPTLPTHFFSNLKKKHFVFNFIFLFARTHASIVLEFNYICSFCVPPNHPLNIFFSRTIGPIYTKHWGLGYIIVCSNYDPGLWFNVDCMQQIIF